MAFSIQTANSELEAMLHGTTLSQVQNIYGIHNRAARQLLLDIDPQETRRITQITSPIFYQIYDYTVPEDLKGNKIIDIRPQVNRNLNTRFTQNYNEQFDLYKNSVNNPNFTIQHNSATKTIRIDADFAPQGVVINTADDITSNGTWSVGGNGSNLTQDSVNYAVYSGALTFNMSGGTQATLTNSTMSAVDLTDYENQSSIFAYVYLPTASNFTSIEIRWGSDASNYWSRSLTTTQTNNSFQNGWNLLQAQWSGATKVGSPDVVNVDYVQVIYNYNGTSMNGVKLNGFVCQLGKILEMEYYSKYLFRNSSTGVFQETVLTDSDLINLDTETYNLFLYQAAFLSVQQALGQDAGYDTQIFLQKYNEGIEKYKQMYKSEVKKPQNIYYRKSNPNANKYIGWGTFNR